MAAVVEKYVNSIRELSGSIGSLSALFSFIQSNLEALGKVPVIQLDNALETLTPEQHSLGILGILLAKYQQLAQQCAGLMRKYMNVDNAELTKLLTQTDEFVRACSAEQVRCAVDLFNLLLWNVTEMLIERKEAIRGISIATNAIEKIRTNESQLTGSHTYLCHLCLSARTFAPAIPYLDQDISDIQKAAGQVATDSMNFLLYYYYGGMIYTALKRFSRAKFFFEIVISTPASAISAIMVEAHKKLLLVHLISERCDITLPKTAGPFVMRHIKPLCPAYHELMSAFISSNQQKMQAVVDKYRLTYTADLNYGLVKQCVTALYKKNIQKLTKTFLTLSLVDVAARAQLSNAEEAENYLRNMIVVAGSRGLLARVLIKLNSTSFNLWSMVARVQEQQIENGEIYASISKANGMVEFHDNPERYNNPQMLSYLQKQEKECISLNTRLSDMERIISTTPDYVNKVTAYQTEEDGSKPSTSFATNT